MVNDILISDVKIGDRTRADLGDIKALAMSIKQLGLLHPIVIDSEDRLIAGARRIAAAKLIGVASIPYTRVDLLDDAVLAIRAERDENTCRKPFTPTEMVAIGKRLEALEKPRAKERQGTRTDLQHPDHVSRKLTTARDAVGAALGVSGATYERAKSVVAALEHPDEAVREAAAEAVAEMDASGQVHPAYEKVRAARTGKAIEDLREQRRRSERQMEGVDARAVRGNRRNEKTTLTKCVMTIADTADVLEGVQLDDLDGIPVEQLAADLANAMTKIRRVLTQLRSVQE